MGEIDKKENEATSYEPYDDFRDLIPEKNNEEKEKEEKAALRKRMLPRHILSVVVYVLGMTMLVAILQIIILFIPGSTIKYNPEEELIRNVSGDLNGVAFMSPDIYSEYRGKYSETLKDFKYNDEYLVLVSKENFELLYYDETENPEENQSTQLTIFQREQQPELEWFMKDIFGEVVINKELFIQLANGDIKQWSKFRKINIYVTTTELGIRPSFVNYEKVRYTEIEGDGLQFTTGAGNVLNFLVYAALLPALGFLLFPNIKDDWEKFKQNKSLLIGIFAGLGFVYGASLTITLLFQLFNVPQLTSANQASIETQLLGPGWPLMLISAVILGPIIEELIFRKAIFELTRNKWVGLAVSSIIFASIHVVTELGDITNFAHFLITFLPYLAMGAAFGATYIVYKQNVITVIGAHMLWNLIATLVVLLGPYLPY